MLVITDEFKNAVLGLLLDLRKGQYLTRAMICEELKVDNKYEAVVSALASEPDFADFEMVKARGFRKKFP